MVTLGDWIWILNIIFLGNVWGIPNLDSNNIFKWICVLIGKLWGSLNLNSDVFINLSSIKEIVREFKFEFISKEFVYSGKCEDFELNYFLNDFLFLRKCKGVWI